KDVALVMRGGKTLYGDDNVVAGLRLSGCDAFEMCGAFKQVCVQDEVGKSWPAFAAENADIYPAYFCGPPPGEPTCKPSRPKAVNNSTIYTGDITNSDLDGDGIDNRSDHCPLDDGRQADGDGDGVGDSCDVCPLAADVTTCPAFDPKDRDGDGDVDSADNCPGHANANQADADGDGKGDVCDDCPMTANPGAGACPGSIYGVKEGTLLPDIQVRLAGALVTGKGSNGFFLQVKETDAGYKGANYSGIFVFTTNATFLAQAEIGGRVNVEGQITNFFGQLELSNVASVSRVRTTTEASPAPTMVTIDEARVGGSRAVALESVLVRLGSSTVTAINSGTGEFTATQGQVSLPVDDFVFLTNFFPPVGQAYSTLTGILALRSSS
ncbi:MAG TPA: thrombospondin type 3 repeat-containing protein, partial [Ilumatobacteraceae bacterium]|nr:thrombospondin type 3 repeat-containing protein [Ilumatobacteraceae bacterium]